MGAITFEQAGTAIPGCASIATHPAGASATVTCQTAFAGSASTLSAVFTPSPDAQVTGSDSSAVGFVLGRAVTATTMHVPAHVTLGKRLTVTAKVVPQAGTTGVSPTGTVVFLDGKKTIEGCTPALAGGIARCTVTYKRLGKHSISADYLGDANFSGSATSVHKLAVVVAKPTGYVSSLMTWTFQYKPRYTRVSTLLVTGVQPGLKISVGLHGQRLPQTRIPRHGQALGLPQAPHVQERRSHQALRRPQAGRRRQADRPADASRLAGQVLLVRRPPRPQAEDRYDLSGGRPDQAGRGLHLAPPIDSAAAAGGA